MTDKRKILDIKGKILNKPINVFVEKEEGTEYYKAVAPDIKAQGTGKTKGKAVESLNQNICDTYESLMKNDNFTDEWLNIKNDLLDRIKKKKRVRR